MSKSQNMVKWCLNKAKLELEKGQKHRGLVEVKPNNKLAWEHVKKAEHNLDFFLLSKEHGFYDWAISVGFYVIYHCCLAILAKFGYESRNQECTLALIEGMIEDNKISKDFRSYLDAMKPNGAANEEQLIELREKYQYTPVIEIDEQKVKELLGLCQDMVKDAKGIIQ